MPGVGVLARLEKVGRHRLAFLQRLFEQRLQLLVVPHVRARLSYHWSARSLSMNADKDEERRNRSRHRARCGPMPPILIDSVALISAYDAGGSLISMESSFWQRSGSSEKAARTAACSSAASTSCSICGEVSGSSWLSPASSVWSYRLAVRITRKHSRAVVVGIQPGRAAGGRPLPSCPPSSSHRVGATSSVSDRLS